ncbi:uncharacterized protein RHO25_010282 [Cercospora beticola]|uniref:SnoaL-like domain-containing protein n=1 Tax=Cercospora beticola TaxID=122368 RepID=A0ABZ0P1Z7_CERBT|nr:hypothetical protein RHO25_010282 [Cercospora beticola]
MSFPESPGVSSSATPASEQSGESSSTTAHSAGVPAPGQSVAQYLESICVSGVLAINDRDFDYENNDLHKCVAPSFRAHFENFPHPLTLLEHSTLLRQTIEAFPAYHAEVKNINSEVKEERGEATVYMESEITGAPEGVKTILMNEFKFRKVDGCWRCFVHHVMKGIGDHSPMMNQF